MYYYKYDRDNLIHVPAPYERDIIPIFMGDDDQITDAAFSVHITEWQPGCEVDDHFHEANMEAMYCMSGSGLAYINGEEYPFVPDTMIVAPPGVYHRIVNTGKETLRVLCVFSPPNTAASLKERAMEAVEASGGYTK